MSLTYPNDTDTHQDDAVYTPVYARGKARSKKKGIKTWMILAPVGGVVLLGGAAMMLLYPSNEAAPLVEAEAPVVSAMAPIAPEPALLDSAAPAPVTSAAAPAPVAMARVNPAPVSREAAPARRAEPSPARRVAETSAAPLVQAAEPVIPTGPQPYGGTATLNSTSRPAPATPAPVATPAPAITVQPLN